MGRTGGWDGGTVVPDRELIYTMSSRENRNPRTTVVPRPVPDEVVSEPSRRLVAQRRRVREQLVTYTAMADALEYMEYKLSTREEKEQRRTNPWINMDDGAAIARARFLKCRRGFPADGSSAWDSDIDEHAIPRWTGW